MAPSLPPPLPPPLAETPAVLTAAAFCVRRRLLADCIAEEEDEDDVDVDAVAAAPESSRVSSTGGACECRLDGVSSAMGVGVWMGVGTGVTSVDTAVSLSDSDPAVCNVTEVADAFEMEGVRLGGARNTGTGDMAQDDAVADDDDDDDDDVEEEEEEQEEEEEEDGVEEGAAAEVEAEMTGNCCC